MNFVLIFNNDTFQNSNSNLINTVKRWLIYQINKIIYPISGEIQSNREEYNNSRIQNNIYNKIVIIRTYQNITISEYELINENLEKIIITINNIIFKNYNDILINPYNDSTLNNDELIDLIIKYYKLQSTITIINSSSNYLLFDDIYEKFEKDNELLLNEHNKLIGIINISKFNFNNKYNLFIQFYINSRSLHIKDIISIELINYFNDMISKPGCDITRNLYKSNSLEDKENTGLSNEKTLKSHINLVNYLNLFEECENNCIHGIKCDEEKLIILNNIKINYNNTLEINKNVTMNDSKIFEIHFNLLINNVIKNIKRNQPQIIIIPIDNIDKEIYETNIKYILEFYSIIYPKLLNNYFDSNYKNNTMIKTSNIKRITELIIKKNNKVELEEENLSLNYTISNISMTNWIDEYNEYNPFGILIKYNISKHSYKGLIDDKSTIIKTFPNMIVDSISNNWISLYDYYQLIISYKSDEYYNYEDENKVNKFNLNNFKINDSIHGETNIMLPMYINKNHWNLVKSLWRYHISFINNSFESEYNKKMDNIYYLVLLKYFTNLSDNTITSVSGETEKHMILDNNIILFIYILRTTIQISIDNKYINTIANEYSRYFNYLINLDNKVEKNLIELNLIDYIIRYIQFCVSFCNITNLEKDLIKIRELLFNRWFIKSYDENIMYKEYYSNLGENEKKKELDIIKNNFITEYTSWLNLEIMLLKLSKVISSIYKIKGFNQFIKFIDKSDSYLDDSCNELSCSIIKNIINYNNNNNNNFGSYLENIKKNIKIEFL